MASANAFNPDPIGQRVVLRAEWILSELVEKTGRSLRDLRANPTPKQAGNELGCLLRNVDKVRKFVKKIDGLFAFSMTPMDGMQVDIKAARAEEKALEDKAREAAGGRRDHFNGILQLLRMLAEHSNKKEETKEDKEEETKEDKEEETKEDKEEETKDDESSEKGEKGSDDDDDDTGAADKKDEE